MNGTHDPGKLWQLARSLARLSVATRILGIAALAVSAILVLYALSQLGSHTSDAVGFTLLGLAVALFGVLVWATGTFHATFAHSVGLLGSVESQIARLNELVARQRPPPGRTVSSGAAEPALPAPEPVVAAAAAPAREPVAVASPAPAPPLTEADAQLVEDDAEPGGPGEAAAAEPTRSEPAAGEPAGPTPQAEAPAEPPRKSCPHCGGSIHREATRCVHCMRKVPA